jgi:heme oxygenase
MSHDHAASSAPAPANSIMARLKAETQELHTTAERHPFMASMIRGQLTHAQYAMHLEQMLLVHQVLEGALARAISTQPWGKAIHPEQFIERHLLADLAHFGGSSTPRAASATTALIARIEQAEREQPLMLLGMHYVTEGSKNGAVFIARALRGAYQLPPGVGDRSLDPYGPEQRAKWASFRTAVDALTLCDADCATVIDGANTMFRSITAMAEEAWSRMASSLKVETPARSPVGH